MLKRALVKLLSTWAERSLAVGGEHCIDLRPRFRIPGAGVVDLLSVRHARDQFMVGLWAIQDGPIDQESVDAMTRRIHAFEGWYAELTEHAETQGFRSAHRISVCGNLMGRSVVRGPLIDLLSNWRGALCFWAGKRTAAGALSPSPFYGKAPSLVAGRAQLKALLHHLPWRDLADHEPAAPAV